MMLQKKNILLVFGTRPEAIKMAPLYQELKKIDNTFTTTVLVTGQHREMLDQVLQVFKIVPDLDLDLMTAGQNLTGLTSSILTAVASNLSECRPDIVLVHGDTTTALATAQAAFYLGIPVGHVEAGLRTFDLRNPFPEEFNRQIIGKIAEWHFAPTAICRENLMREGVSSERIWVTGNTVIDALQWVSKEINRNPSVKKLILARLNKILPSLWQERKYVLVTGHRRENFGERFFEICSALKDAALQNQDVNFIYPVHLNPSVRNPVLTILSNLDNVHLIAPLDYETFVYLLRNCYFVLTDSGGIQEEAPSFGKPVLVMRDVTERPEAITAGTVRLVGSDKNRILSGINSLTRNGDVYLAMSKAHNPYGDGRAATRIVEILRKIWNEH